MQKTKRDYLCLDIGKATGATQVRCTRYSKMHRHRRRSTAASHTFRGLVGSYKRGRAPPRSNRCGGIRGALCCACQGRYRSGQRRSENTVCSVKLQSRPDTTRLATSLGGITCPMSACRKTTYAPSSVPDTRCPTQALQLFICTVPPRKPAKRT